MHPFSAGLFAWETGVVFTLHSLQMLAEPATAGTRLGELAWEKQRAFSDGAFAAGTAALTGAAAPAVWAAAMAPVQGRVRANLRSLGRGWR